MNGPKLTNNIISKGLIKIASGCLSLLFSLHFFTLSAQELNESLGVKVVVIDAGHGGKDGGTVGKNEIEKNIALSIALKTGKFIEENLKDVKVIYTRDKDIFIELHERAMIANRAKADLFMSIHVDGYTNANPYGTGTYVMGLAKTEANLRAAMRENESILLEENYQEKYENFDPNSPESYIVLVMQQSAFLNQSLDFAARVQEQFRERVGRNDRGVKQAPFLVLHQTTMPSVLIETGFITNSEEEKFLMSEIGQDYMASAIYRAFKDYKTSIEDRLKSSFQLAEELKHENAGNVNKGMSGLVFKVQLATSATKIDVGPQNFKGLKGVEVYEAAGLYRYTYGSVPTMDEASLLQDEVRGVGYKDAFVVSFHDGKRISVNEAIKLLNNR